MAPIIDFSSMGNILSYEVWRDNLSWLVLLAMFIIGGMAYLRHRKRWYGEGKHLQPNKMQRWWRGRRDPATAAERSYEKHLKKMRKVHEKEINNRKKALKKANEVEEDIRFEESKIQYEESYFKQKMEIGSRLLKLFGAIRENRKLTLEQFNAQVYQPFLDTLKRFMIVALKMQKLYENLRHHARTDYRTVIKLMHLDRNERKAEKFEKRASKMMRWPREALLEESRKAGLIMKRYKDDKNTKEMVDKVNALLDEALKVSREEIGTIKAIQKEFGAHKEVMIANNKFGWYEKLQTHINRLVRVEQREKTLNYAIQELFNDLELKEEAEIRSLEQEKEKDKQIEAAVPQMAH